jgi:phosphoribosylformylglycinamidine cyclo-ligase
MQQIGEGLNEGARQADIDIVGGETATLSGLITGLDLAGTCLGIQDRKKIITGESIVPDDVIVGIPSSGVHSNGLTLARRIVEDCGGYDQKLPTGRTIGEELLVPTRIYREVLQITKRDEIHGMCHVTGGGLRNFTRLSSFGFDLTDPIAPQPIFSWLQERGQVPAEEMYRTFNMGMGYAFIAPEASVPGIRKFCPDAKVVGTISACSGVRIKGIAVR